MMSNNKNAYLLVGVLCDGYTSIDTVFVELSELPEDYNNEIVSMVMASAIYEDNDVTDFSDKSTYYQVKEEVKSWLDIYISNLYSITILKNNKVIELLTLTELKEILLDNGFFIKDITERILTLKEQNNG